MAAQGTAHRTTKKGKVKDMPSPQTTPPPRTRPVGDPPTGPLVGGDPGLATPRPSGRPAEKPRTRKAWPWVLLVVLLIVAIGGGMWWAGYASKASEPIVATASTPRKEKTVKLMSCKPGEANYSLAINGAAQMFNAQKDWEPSGALKAVGNYGDPSGRVGDITFRTTPTTLKIVNIEVWNLVPPDKDGNMWEVRTYVPYEMTPATTVRASNAMGNSEVQACVALA